MNLRVSSLFFGHDLLNHFLGFLNDLRCRHHTVLGGKQCCLTTRGLGNDVLEVVFGAHPYEFESVLHSKLSYVGGFKIVGNDLLADIPEVLHKGSHVESLLRGDSSAFLNRNA